MITKEHKLISKIIRETQEGKIKWELVMSIPTSLLQSEKMIEYPFKATIADKVFRLFKYESKFFTDEESYEWISSYRLEMLAGNSDRSGYTFPEINSLLSDLYDEVRRQVTKIDDFMDSYLEDESPSDDLFP